MSSNKRQKHDHSHNDGLTQIRQEMSRVLNECSELKAKVANLEAEVKSLQTSVKKANQGLLPEKFDSSGRYPGMAR